MDQQVLGKLEQFRLPFHRCYMSDTIITMDDGGRFYPSSSTDSVQCNNCDNIVDTPAEIASYPDGNCPDYAKACTDAKQHTSTTVTITQAASEAPVQGLYQIQAHRVQIVPSVFDLKPA